MNDQMARASDQSKTGFVTIATVRSRAEAQALAAKLKAAGIDSLMSVERAVSMPTTGSSWLGGIKVQVNRSNVEAALRVLQRARGGEQSPHPPVSEPSGGRASWPIDLESWPGVAIAVAGLVAVAALLALWLF
jgi:hypothetical protein